MSAKVEWNRRSFIKGAALAGAIPLIAGGSMAQQNQDKNQREQVPSGQVPKKPLGRTGVQVSAMGIGGYHLGSAETDQAANEIVASVNEEDIGELKPGMKAQIRLYAYPDKDMTGTLLSVGSSSVNQSYPVRFSLDDSTENLLPGMTGEMNVILGEHKNALTIPSRAIRHGNTVLTVENGIVHENHVDVGFRTLETSEITGGLDEGASVILSNQDLYKPGMHVRELNAKDN